MSDERIGHLIAVTERLADDVKEIKDNMVTRREFDLRVSEHEVFKTGIDRLDDRVDTLESHHDKGHIARKVGNRALIVFVGLIVTAIGAAFLGVV